MRGARVGIFGGTFNPIHFGHLRAAEEVTEALDLQRMIFVPSAQPPHKRSSDEDPIAPAAERLAWVRAALRDHARFEVDAIEVERGGSSYSVDTLRVLRSRAGGNRRCSPSATMRSSRSEPGASPRRCSSLRTSP